MTKSRSIAGKASAKPRRTKPKWRIRGYMNATCDTGKQVRVLLECEKCGCNYLFWQMVRRFPKDSEWPLWWKKAENAAIARGHCCKERQP